MGDYKQTCPECNHQLTLTEKRSGWCQACKACWDHPRVPVPEAACRECGCTDNDCRQCIEAQGYPCSWAEPDLCSRCAEELEERTFGKEHPAPHGTRKITDNYKNSK